MKKIAHFVETFPVAGNDYIYNQVINNRDIQSILIAERPLKGNSPFNLCPFYYKKPLAIPFFDRLGNKLNDGILNRLYISRFNAYAMRILRENSISIMHAHFGMEGYKLIGLRERLGLPLVITFYGVDVSYCLKDRLWLERLKLTVKSADKLIVLCEEARERLIGLGAMEQKVCLWNVGLDLEGFPYEERKCREGGFKFLTAARFVEKKGYPVLLKAFSILAKKRNDVSLTALGYGPLKRQIEGMIADLGIRERVTLIDTSGKNDFNEFYRRILSSHDIFVLPSITAKDGDDEGGPALSMVCAQAAGLPVIATPFAGASVSVEENKTGLFVRNADEQDLAQKMDYLISNFRLCKRLGEAGSNCVREKFSLAKQIKELDGIYASLN